MSLLNTCLTVGLLVTAVRTYSTPPFGQGGEPSGARRLEVGHLKSRALLQCAKGAPSDAPLAIIVPGTRAHGPDEAMPPSITADGKEGSGRILDVAMRNPHVRGLVFLGYHGHSLKEMVDFQAYRRPVDMVVKTDVDADHDGSTRRRGGYLPCFSRCSRAG